jgi:flagellar FliL protein
MAEKDAAKPEKKGSGILKILLILIGGLILVGGSIGATLFLTGALNKGAGGEEHGAAAPAPAHGAANVAIAPIPLRGPPIYLPIDPAFVVNFEDQGMLRYLQVGLTVMARNQQIIDAVTQSMPQIRNDLILLFSNQKMEVLNSLNGKEKLRMQALAQIQGILTREIGIPGVEAVYFTAFVLQ